MAVAIVCDPCHAENRLTLGQGWEITIKPPGAEKGETYKIVLGDDEHGKIAEELWALLQAHGEKVSGVFYAITSESKTPALAPPVDPQGGQESPEASPATVDDPKAQEQVSRRLRQDRALRFFNIVEKARIEKGIGTRTFDNDHKLYRSTMLRWQKGEGYPSDDYVSRLTLLLDLNREQVYNITGVRVPERKVQGEPTEPKGEEAPELPPLLTDDEIAASLETSEVKEEPKPFIPYPTSPDWLDRVKAKCMLNTEGSLMHPIKCGVVVPRDRMGSHARTAHEVEHAWEVPWDLVGLPQGLEPVRCPDCDLPFPTSNAFGRHQNDGCPKVKLYGRPRSSSGGGQAYRKNKTSGRRAARR